MKDAIGAVNADHGVAQFIATMVFTMPKQTPAEMYVLAAILPLLATVAVGLRFHARRLQRAGLQWDDWLILVSLVNYTRPLQNQTYGSKDLCLHIRCTHHNWYSYTLLKTEVAKKLAGASLGDEAQHMDLTQTGEPIFTTKYVWLLKANSLNSLQIKGIQAHKPPDALRSPISPDTRHRPDQDLRPPLLQAYLPWSALLSSHECPYHPRFCLDRCILFRQPLEVCAD